MLVKQAVGSVLKQRRAALGLRLTDVATSANVSMQYLSELERGRKEASSEVLDAIAQALDMRPSRIYRDVAEHLERTMPSSVESVVEPAPVVELSPQRADAELLAA